ncbi:MAG TPA: creatininase family protein [Burkholderiaceae bacterium]|nr:creatininase family protein [Burkholderiaceae bacterium]
MTCGFALSIGWRAKRSLQPFIIALLLVALAICGAPARAAASISSVFLEDFTWTELRDAVSQGMTTAIVPVGGTEQSGPALTLGKHNVRVRLLSERIARELGNAVVAPVLSYVPEGSITPPSSHMRFAGTLSIPTSVFDATLEAIAGSLRAHGLRNIVLLGDHGGYQRELGRVAERLNRQWAGGPARVFAPPEYFRASTEGFAALLRERGFRDDEIGTHAALADTSLQLALAPATVRKDVLQSSTRLDQSVGIYGGFPQHASAELGQLGVDEIVRQTVAAIRQQIQTAERGRATAQ